MNTKIQPRRNAEVAILPVGNKFIDVFVGEGWVQHSRFALVKGHAKLVAGAPLTGEQYNIVRSAINA